MLQSSEREALREVFFRAWRHYREARPLEELERILVDVALRHPAYHRVLDDPDTYLDRDYPPEKGEGNPFLHLSLHVAIHEQLAGDRPTGVRAAHQALLARLHDAHEVEHRMMDCLARTMWEAQRSGALPSEREYLDCLERQDRP